MGTYLVRVQLDERFAQDDLERTLRTDRLHPLHDHGVRLATSASGGVQLDVSLTAVDLWTAVLSTMGLVHHLGCAPAAVDACTVAEQAWLGGPGVEPLTSPV